MDAGHHDMVLAITSHIPHLVAYNIVGTVADLEQDTQSEVIKFSASGFRDFTRIAASDPVMWRDVFLTNREAVLEMLGRFLEDLSKLQRMVRVGDGPGMEALFTRTRKIRRSIITAGQETAAADFGRPHGEAKTVSGPSGTVELTGTPAPLLDINVEVDRPVREHGGGDDA
jgi:cyclohexadieny/prephenate dehydrogenase